MNIQVYLLKGAASIVDEIIITGEKKLKLIFFEMFSLFDLKWRVLVKQDVFLACRLKDHMDILSHEESAMSLLDRFDMNAWSKPMTTPKEPSLKLIKEEGNPLADATLFWQLDGSLIYLTITRHDISYSGCYCSVYA